MNEGISPVKGHQVATTLFTIVFILFLDSTSLVGHNLLQSTQSKTYTQSPKASTSPSHTTANLPPTLTFEENRGQTAPHVDFLARATGYVVFLTSGQAVLKFSDSNLSHVVRLELVGAQQTPRVIGEGRLVSQSHYLVGHDMAKWHTDIAHYRAVTYRHIYDGIDLRYYGKHRQLEYDFIVAAGANPEIIHFNFDGADALAIAENGDLILSLPHGKTIRSKSPITYQETGQGREIIGSRYHLNADGSVGFTLDAYDTRRTLIIDPVLSYTTYLGGSVGSEAANAVTIDTAGHAYMTGYTSSADFPGADLGTSTGLDVFVTKLSVDGSSAVYSTYFGGAGNDQGTAIAVDAAGQAHIVGHTASSDFATTAGAFDTGHNDGSDAFLAILNANGNGLIYSTYYGGQGNNDAGQAIAVDSSGMVYIAGGTDSNNSGGSPGKNDSQPPPVPTIRSGVGILTHLLPSLIHPAGAQVIYCIRPTWVAAMAMKPPMASC